MRGYACIAADSPKDMNNFGGLLRAAHCYGAAMVVLGNDRYKQSCADTTKAHRHIPFLRVKDVFDALPFDCVPVAVDLIDGAKPLHEYQHPESAFYIFGPEDGTLGERITSRCRDVIYIPTQYCMNLAATVNVVLYDRLAKQSSRSGEK